MQVLIICLTFLMLPNLYGQTLIEKARFPIDNYSVWTVDGLGNVLTAQSGTIKKYNKDGKIIFEQGVKQIGNCKSIGQMNTLKTYVFSEEQQLICFYDNSLSPLEKCIDLSDYNFANISLIEYSNQAGKFWVFDQINSTLSQISIEETTVVQTTKNMKGMLNIQSPIQLIESGNQLFIFDENKIVYIFDRYGTFIERIEIPYAKSMQVNSKYLIFLIEKQLQFMNINEKMKLTVELPYEHIKSFIVLGNNIYLATSTEIIKTELLLPSLDKKR